MAEKDSDSAGAEALVRHFGQVSLDSSPVLTAKTPKFARKYSLRELEIQQTIGRCTWEGWSPCVACTSWDDLAGTDGVLWRKIVFAVANFKTAHSGKGLCSV